MTLLRQNTKTILIRSETPADAPRMSEVTELVFRNAAHTCGREHQLVEDLRAARALTVSLVVVSDSGIVGHLAGGLGNWTVG